MRATQDTIWRARPFHCRNRGYLSEGHRFVPETNFECNSTSRFRPKTVIIEPRTQSGHDISRYACFIGFHALLNDLVDCCEQYLFQHPRTRPYWRGSIWTHGVLLRSLDGHTAATSGFHVRQGTIHADVEKGSLSQKHAQNHADDVLSCATLQSCWPTVVHETRGAVSMDTYEPWPLPFFYPPKCPNKSIE